MRLVQFTGTEDGNSMIFIQPMAVGAVRMGPGSTTEIQMVWGNMLSVKEPILEVTKRLLEKPKRKCDCEN